MAKADFCFNFYDGDATRDMAHMNRLERGAYTDVLIQQRQRGHLSLDFIKKILGHDFDSVWSSVELSLKTDNEGLYYIEWVDNSIISREEYSVSRSRNKSNSLNGQTYLYLITDSVTGFTKIGISLDPEIRLKEIIKYCKDPLLKDRDLKIIFKSKELIDKKEEQKLHKKFILKRISGEWFNLNSEDINNISTTYDKTYVQHMVYGNGNGNGNEDGIEKKLNEAFDEIYLDQQRPKWKTKDFDFELSAFREKVRGSPDHYRTHDSGGIKLAFQSQLRNAKNKQHVNGQHNKTTSGDFVPKQFSGANYKTKL